jgi:hypothetical protein
MKIVGLATFVILGGLLTILILHWTDVLNLKYLNPMGIASLLCIGIAVVFMVSWATQRDRDNTEIFFGKDTPTSIFSLLAAFVLLVFASLLATVDRFSNLSSIDIIDYVAWGLIIVLMSGQAGILYSKDPNKFNIYTNGYFDFSIVFSLFLCNVLLLLRQLGVDVIVKKRED